MAWRLAMLNRRTEIRVTALGILGLLPVGIVVAHHAANVYFDVSTVIEVRGVISDLKWQNPHIGFTLESRDENGAEATWMIESNSVSTLRQLGITPDQLEIGALVTVAGWPAKQGGNRMSGNHVLLPDGHELVLRGSGVQHFSEGMDERITVADIEASDVGDATGLGLFRVWSTVAGDPDQDRLWADSYPLTEAAIAARAAWDPVRDNPAIRCEPKGIPGIVDPPYPMELIDNGDTIVILQEEFDTVRTIHMNPATTPNSPEASLLGHSVGHWEEETLVVETTQVSWPYFDNRGIPQSEQTRFEERFTVSADGRRLNYTLETTDPQTFTEPVVLDRFWLWRPENQVERYNCTPL
jgi:hypothetical protein